MWLTGFDAPCMHTMYVDKPMKGHGLMQAIARVNRVFRDKPAGLVVDYIGVAQNLKSALGQYSGADREQTGIDEAEAVAVLLEKYEIVRAMFRPDTKGGFDYRPALTADATPQAAPRDHGRRHRLGADHAAGGCRQGDHRGRQEAGASPLCRCRAGAVEGVRAGGGERRGPSHPRRGRLLSGDPRRAGQERARRRQEERRRPRAGDPADRQPRRGLDRDRGHHEGGRDSRARTSRSCPTSSWPRCATCDKKNLAIEALKKLINGEVRSQRKRNVTQSKAFSERLEAAIARYHANAITTAQVLEELIQLAKDIRAARARGEETGLTDEEIAFYDALAENESARQVMGEPALRVIAHELVTSIKGNVTVDWMHRETRARRHAACW